MNAIVLVDKCWGIGLGGLQIPSFSEDRRQFRLLTGSSTGMKRGFYRMVVMGRKTFEGDLKGKPLKDRINVVLTSQKEYVAKNPGIYAVSDPMEVLKLADAYECQPDLVWCIGGESVYRLFLDLELIDKVFITMINAEYACDRHFLDLDDPKNGFRFSFGMGDDEWRASKDTGIYYRFACYQKV